MENPLTAYTTGQLRERRSVKWRQYGDDVLPLWVAEMDTPLAPPIQAALVAAVERGDTGYADAGGLPAAYADFSARRYGWRPDPAHMALVPDVLRGITETLRLVTEPGAGVLVNTPAYPPFFSEVPDAGRRIVQSPLARAVDGTYRLDPNRLDTDLARPDVDVYLLCNPHNPTGTVFTRDELATVAALAERHAVRMLVDEIHAPLTYPGAVHVPFGSLDTAAAASAFTFVSASKAWNLPGLKAALALAGPESWPDLARMGEGVGFGAGLLGVIASEAAFTAGSPWLNSLLAGLAANRSHLADLLAEHLPEVRYAPPEATYLAWLDCRALGLGDDPAEVFLAKGHVAVTPGPAFGPPGHGHVRVNLATSPDRVAEAVRRMAAAVSTSRTAS